MLSTIQKAFIFIVLVLALLAAAVNLVLFAQRTNWKAEAARLEGESKTAKANLAKMEAEFKSASAADKSKILELQTRVNTLDADLTNTSNLLANTEQDKGLLTALATELKAKVEIMSQNMTALADRTTALEAQKQQAEARLAETKTIAQNAEEQLVIANRRNRDLMAKTDSLIEQLAAADERIKKLVQQLEIAKAYGVMPAEPAGVSMGATIYGKITGLAKDGTIVYVSIGSDDGIKEGMPLVIYKPDGTYVATAKVFDAAADKSTARVIPPVSGTIMEGDNVANK